MSYRPYLITVSGNILAKEGKNYAQNWVARTCWNPNAHFSRGVYDEHRHSIAGELIFDKSMRAAPYAIYVANGAVGIAADAVEGTDLSCAPGYYPAFAYFNEYIKEIRDVLQDPVSERVSVPFYNGLYCSAFSVLELFLCDFLLCGVFGKDVCFRRALETLGISDNTDQFDIEKRTKDIIYHKVFHRFSEIKKLYKSILGFPFPDSTELEVFLHKRHNIVHRFALSSIDRMRVCNASYVDVMALIETICKFVDGLKGVCGLTDEEMRCLELNW